MEETTLSLSLVELEEKVRKTDQEIKSRLKPGYQHHEIMTVFVRSWIYQTEELLRTIYGTEKD